MKRIKVKTLLKNNKLILPQNQPVNKSSESEHPIFCLKNIQKEYCLSKCQRDEKAEFASTLHKLSQLTWNQIRHSDRHKSGCETIKRESIKRPVPEMVPQDANILAFRFSGM